LLLSELLELSEEVLLELSVVDVVVLLEVSLPTEHATSTAPATPVTARAAVIPPTLRSPVSLSVAMT
jgi:hypothetical protein